MADGNGRRQFIGGVIAAGLGISSSGCLDDGEIGQELLGDGDTVEEPDELPRTLSEDGVRLETLRAATVDTIREKSFETGAVGQELEDGQISESHGVKVRATRVHERGLIIEAEHSERIDRDGLRDADDVRIEYVDGDQQYRGPDDPQEMNRGSGFDDLVEDVENQAVDDAFTLLEEVTWGEPEWDSERGVYVVPVDGFQDDDLEVHSGELHVGPDGVPVAVSGRVEDRGDVIEGEMFLSPGHVDVSEPEWVSDADVQVNAAVQTEVNYAEGQIEILLVDKGNADEFELRGDTSADISLDSVGDTDVIHQNDLDNSPGSFDIVAVSGNDESVVGSVEWDDNWS